MKYTLLNEIEDTASSLKIPFTRLYTDQAFEIRKLLAERFSRDKNFPLKFSWQNIVGRGSFFSKYGWRLVGDYVKDTNVLLLVSPDEELTIWEFQSGHDLVSVLGETTSFPFCVTSKEANYVLCFEDHNCLIGTGSITNSESVEEWLQSLREARDRET